MTQRLAVPTIVLLASFAIRAQEPGRQGGPGGFGLPRGFAIFQALDTDHDNTLTRGRDRRRRRRPQGDGQERRRQGHGRRDPACRPGAGVAKGAAAAAPVSATKRRRRRRPPTRWSATLMAFDKNKDGKLTKAEVPERMQGMFERADDNQDGVLTAEEIKAAAAAQPQPAASRPGGEGRRGEGGRGGRRAARDALFSALDKDGDGTLSADEIAGAAASLRTLDSERRRHRCRWKNSSAAGDAADRPPTDSYPTQDLFMRLRYVRRRDRARGRHRRHLRAPPARAVRSSSTTRTCSARRWT